jgi:hypothetical protein
MENLYVWLFFAGATLVVLGIFLLFSERALKKNDANSMNTDAVVGSPRLRVPKRN